VASGGAAGVRAAAARTAAAGAPPGDGR
jgi:hypothetical protein